MEHVANGLYIGDIQDISPVADTPVEPDEFDHVITLGNSSTPYTTETYAVETNPAPWRPFFEAIDVTRQALRTKEVKAFVHCQVGKSRVIAVTATAIAAEEGVDFDTGLAHVQQLRQSEVHEELRGHAERYLELEAEGGQEWEMDGELKLDS